MSIVSRYVEGQVSKRKKRFIGKEGKRKKRFIGKVSKRKK
jgi:hypothetical protein